MCGVCEREREVYVCVREREREKNVWVEKIKKWWEMIDGERKL